MYNPKTEEIFLSLYASKKYEVIEEIDVPEDEDPEDYLLQLRTEVDLGEMCERSTRY